MGVLTPADITAVAEATTARIVDAIQGELTSLEDWCAGNETRRTYRIERAGPAQYTVTLYHEKGGHYGAGPSVRAAADNALKAAGYVPLR